MSNAKQAEPKHPTGSSVKTVAVKVDPWYGKGPLSFSCYSSRHGKLEAKVIPGVAQELPEPLAAHIEDWVARNPISKRADKDKPKT